MKKYFRAVQRQGWKILQIPNVVGVGVGYKHVGLERTDRPAVIVFVSQKIAAQNLSREFRVPFKINGLETDVIEIGEVRLLDTRTNKLRPAQPGMSIGHYKITAGTFGAVVKDRETGEQLILSNNHILANATDGNDGRASIGDSILQPGSYDGGSNDDQIATLLRFIPISRGVGPATCPIAIGAAGLANKVLHFIRPNYDLRIYKRQHVGNKVDCALAKPVDHSIINSQVIELGQITGVAQASPGMMVTKSGRTSGVTSGKVTATGVTLNVQMEEDDNATFVDQVVTDMSSKPGDSGSIILTEGNRVVGLLFAGSDQYTIFNPIQNVMDQLNVEF